MSSIELDRQRVKILFEINTLLLYRVQLFEIRDNPNLNVSKIPLSEVQLQTQLSSINVNIAEIKQHYLKRVQLNLTCVAELNEKYRPDGKPRNSNKPIFPQILSPPPESTPEISSRYERLIELFPDAVTFLQQQRQNQSMNKQAVPAVPGFNDKPNNTYSSNNSNHSNSSTPMISNLNTPMPPHGTLRNSNNNTNNNSPLMGNSLATANISPHGSATSTPSIPSGQQQYYNKNYNPNEMLLKLQQPIMNNNNMMNLPNKMTGDMQGMPMNNMQGMQFVGRNNNSNMGLANGANLNLNSNMNANMSNAINNGTMSSGNMNSGNMSGGNMNSMNNMQNMQNMMGMNPMNMNMNGMNMNVNNANSMNMGGMNMNMASMNMGNMIPNQKNNGMNGINNSGNSW